MRKSTFFLIIIFCIVVSGLFLPQPVLAAENRTINFNLSSSRAIPKNIHGVNANWFTLLPIDYNVTKAAINELGFNQVRFPGGTVANYYDWANFAPNWDIINTLPNVPDFVKNSKPYFDFRVKHLSPLTFGQAITAMGKETTYVVNLATNTNAEIISGLQKLKDNGVTVKRIEMGNEFYLNSFGMTVDMYLDRSKEINDTAKQLFPGVKTAVVINRDLWTGRNKSPDWNIPNQDWYDAVIIHAYSTVIGMSQENFVKWVRGVEETGGSRRNTFAKFVDLIKKTYPNKELWLTEWDISEYADNEVFANTYAQSYYVYDFLLEALKYPIITVANHHSLNDTLKPKANISTKYFNPSNPQPVPNGQYSFDEFFFKRASHWPLAWIGKAFSKYNRFAIGSDAQDGVTAVYFYNQQQPNQGSYALINKTNAPIHPTISGIDSLPNQFQLAVLQKNWSEKSTENSKFTPTSVTITKDEISLPAYGIAYLAPSSLPNPADLTDTGDTPGDEVNIYDYNLLVSDFGKTGSPGWIKADIDKNGKVDIFDYNVLIENFGK